MREYEELRVRVRPVGRGRHLVVANGPATAAEVIEVGDAPAVHRRRWRRLVATELGLSPSGRSHTALELRELGRDVYRLLFPGSLNQCLRDALARVRGERGHELRLRFDLPPELRELPVEALCTPATQPEQTLALSTNVSIVRSLPGGPLGERLPVAGEEPSVLRLLVATASPAGTSLPPLRTDAERRALRDLPSFAVRVDELAHATRRGLAEQLLDHHAELPTVLLLLTHGAYDRERRLGVVYLETERGEADPVPADVLSGMLRKAPRLRLVVLELCHGGDSPGEEPFSGLAQALVGAGLPAVVAMRGLVSDEAAGRLAPTLVRGLVGNLSLDECVTGARHQMSHLPAHTSGEWATPSLFLHHQCRTGRLFTAREVRDDDQPVTDPARVGAEALAAVRRRTGHLHPDVLLTAARHLRDQGAWEEVLRVLAPELPSLRDARAALRAEAACELAWPSVEELCAALADAHDPHAARQAWRDGPPEPVRAALSGELDRLARLATAYQDAVAAADRGDWEAARAGFDAVLARCPTGFRDASRRREAVAEELALDADFRRAERERAAGDWEAARQRYTRLHQRRPGYRGCAELARYVEGRLAEATGDWDGAARAFAHCAGVADAEARSAYARGRAAADAGDWPLAHRCLTVAAEREELRDGWVDYARGRVAEDTERWAAAAAAFEAVGAFLDGPRRALLARSHQAAAAGTWLAALATARAAAAEDADPADARWLARVREQVYAVGVAAADAGDWATAVDHFAALPDDHLDTRARRRHAEGHLACAAGRWARAAAAFADSGHPQAPRLGRYVRGRMLLERGAWDDAQRELAELPATLLDVAEWLLYARGRSADARGDWPGVIAGFGRLPDSFADGDVGSRRLHARARVAADERRWDTVLSLLADLPDDGRDGAVGTLRALAAGRQAEEAGDWAAAARAYGGAADADEDLALAHRYALARGEERAERWDRAEAAYRALPDGHRDAAVRGAYARARAREAAAVSGTAHWGAVVEEYARLPERFADVARRHRYARARRAEADADWPVAAEEATALGAYRDAAALAAYAAGRWAEDSRRWREAARAFRRCEGRHDAAAHLAYVEARLCESDGRWPAAVDRYARAHRAGHALAGARHRRLRRLLDVLPWTARVVDGPLVADPCAQRDPTYPYRALRGAGVGPHASMADVNDAPFTLMRRGTMTYQERVAWDRLRRLHQRLLEDVQLYRWREPDRVRAELVALLGQDGPRSGTELVDVLRARLPGEAPLLTLLAGSREEAVAAWRRRLAETPGDLATVHSLAVAHLWQARELERSGAWEHAVASWRESCAYWAALLTDDGFWERWCAERAETYQRAVLPADTSRLRWGVGQHLADLLASHEQWHTERNRPELAAAYREVADGLECELNGARLLKELGGVRPPARPDTPVACGPRLLRTLGLERALGELVARLDRAAGDGREPGEHAVRELRCAFSELAVAHALCDLHKFEPALRALPRLGRLSKLPEDCAHPGARSSAGGATDDECAHCREFRARNPAYLYLPRRHARLLQDGVSLAIHAHMALARAALTGRGDGLSGALRHWTAALRLAERAAMQVRTRQAVVRMALSRAHTLSNGDGPQYGACLDEAIALVERVTRLPGPLPREARERLAATLADLLAYRGVWRGYTCTRYDLPPDFAGAHADLRRALHLNPESRYARVNLVRGLVFTLDERTGDDHERLVVLGEALRVLHDGLARTDGHGYRDVLDDTLGELDTLLSRDLAADDLLAQLRATEEHARSGAAAPPSQRLVAQADAARERGDVRAAARYLVRAAWAAPSDADLRRALLDTLERLTAEEAGEGADTP